MKDSGIEWIGKIPETWQTFRGKWIMTLLSRPICDSDEIITCFRDGQVTLRRNRREDGFTLADREFGYQGVEPGDLVVHGMDGFAGSIGISDSRGKSTPVLLVLDSKQWKRYLMYVLRSMAYGGVFLGTSTGIRVRSCALNWGKLANLVFPVPPIDEQLVIADYIDKKLESIDSIIADAKAAIEDYRLLEQSIITRVVTKGLDPQVPMKESGAEWAGVCPQPWRMNLLFQLCEEVKSKNAGMRSQNLLSLSHGRIVEKDINTSDGLLPESFEGYNCVRSGDIVLRLTDLQNDHTSLRVGQAQEDGIITSAYTTLRPRNVRLSRFIYYALHVFDLNKGFYGMGSGVRQGLNYDEVKTHKIALPGTIPEMDAITGFLDNESKEIDSIISEQQSLIDDLVAAKKSLMYECATGKRKVD